MHKNNIEEVIDNKYVFPCSKGCIVYACCKSWCSDVFNFCNLIADSMYTMTADEINIYRKTTPLEIRLKIQTMYTYNKRITCPDSFSLEKGKTWSV